MFFFWLCSVCHREVLACHGAEWCTHRRRSCWHRTTNGVFVVVYNIRIKYNSLNYTHSTAILLFDFFFLLFLLLYYFCLCFVEFMYFCSALLCLYKLCMATKTKWLKIGIFFHLPISSRKTLLFLLQRNGIYAQDTIQYGLGRQGLVVSFNVVCSVLCMAGGGGTRW